MVRPATVRIPRAPRAWEAHPPSFRAWSDEWIDMSRVVLKPKTLDTYKGLLRRTILPRFGDLPSRKSPRFRSDGGLSGSLT